MKENTTYRLLLDANWYISASISKKSRRTFYEILTNPIFEVIFSQELLEEYEGVIVRPKFQKMISVTQIKRFLMLVLPQLSEVVLSTTINLSRDVKDNYLLALSFEHEVDYLITGDKDLLVLGKVGKTNILTMQDFQLQGLSQM